MNRKTYARLLVSKFKEMKEQYNCSEFIRSLEQEQLNKIKNATEEEIIKNKLYKEHYLVRYYRKTKTMITELERRSNEIDHKEKGNSKDYKNELMILERFIEKLKTQHFNTKAS